MVQGHRVLSTEGLSMKHIGPRRLFDSARRAEALLAHGMVYDATLCVVREAPAQDAHSDAQDVVRSVMETLVLSR